MSNILRFYLDGQRVGYEVEFSAAHNFLDPDLEKVIIGNAKQHVEGNKMCEWMTAMFAFYSTWQHSKVVF